MHTYTNDDIVTVKVSMKRGKEKLVRIRTGNYPELLPFSDDKACAFARSQADKWQIVAVEIVNVNNCNPL